MSEIASTYRDLSIFSSIESLNYSFEEKQMDFLTEPEKTGSSHISAKEIPDKKKKKLSRRSAMGSFRLLYGEVKRKQHAKTIPDYDSIETYQIHESALLKPSGNYCAVDRPRICICTCSKNVRESSPPTGLDILDASDRNRWNASWVFGSNDD